MADKRIRTGARALRIGGASGFWGDAASATAQLLGAQDLDYIVYDYLAEITMGILARVRATDPALGYATDFITAAMVPNLAEIARQGVRVVSNAGGVNPAGCAHALRKEIARQGLTLRVAVVIGDDLMAQLPALKDAGYRDMFTGAPFPDPALVASANAYLGAFPIAAALDGGADIVITGRCVDSAVTLGACIHEFQWTSDALDRLAGGSLAGHILECGPQATGGNFTDWEMVSDSLSTIGYPIAEVRSDGSFIVGKPQGTGGLVSPGTVSEQMLYEIGDPRAYLLPDVCCDFADVRIAQLAPDRVQVSGARGRAAPASYKTCVTWRDGFRGGHLFGFYGIDAELKAQAFAAAAFARARQVFTQAGAPDFIETSVELIGAESQFGTQRTIGVAREVAAKIAVRHVSAQGVGVFLKEATGLGLASPPGLSGFAGARPKPSPVMALLSLQLPKDQVAIAIDDGQGEQAFVAAVSTGALPADHAPPRDLPAALQVPESVDVDAAMVDVPLVRLAWARSGDKGDSANIGIIARRPAYLPWIWAALDEATVARLFGHFLAGEVERFYLPGIHAINFLLSGVLGGGGTSSLRFDPQGKGYAQLLLCHPIPVPASLLDEAAP